MRIFDPHIHMSSRTTDDYRAMHAAGVRAVVEPAFWLGQPRTSAASFRDYFDSLLGWEPYRAAQYRIQHFCALALNPKEANDPRCAPVLDDLPRYLLKDNVVAVGEIGFDSMTDTEEHAFTIQLALADAHGLPALVHTPHRDKAVGTSRTLELVRSSGIDPGRVLIDHLNEVTVPLVADSGCWMGFSIYPDTKMDPDRMVRILQEYGTSRMLVNSAADWGHSDPLRTAATASAMRTAGFTEEDVEQVLWHNPVAFYAQSGRLALEAEGAGARPSDAADFAGNSVRRGGS
ncbi:MULTISPECIES: TatD family hydrolase [Streptomyces]|uniref:Hydrolase TatD n=1 Tax=Streptomyces viridochromogenes TaxID=1938 RepID=A0A0L8K1J2_STRVR|nr:MULTISPECIES: TatD family hydrolase [Streptomyces]KOG19753.1 hydrolase TatD [Streptomyces viridochromogenes]